MNSDMEKIKDLASKAKSPKEFRDSLGEPFLEKLTSLINIYSREGNSNTPDVILAKYLEKSLAAFEEAVCQREEWHGRNPHPDHVCYGVEVESNGGTSTEEQSLVLPKGAYITYVDFDKSPPYITYNLDGVMAMEDKKLYVPEALAYYLRTHWCGSQKMHDLIEKNTKHEIFENYFCC